MPRQPVSFDLAWLNLRESADHAARDRVLLQRARTYLAAGTDPVAVDLGAGSGATVRAFGGAPAIRWRLVDNDPGLLDAAQRNDPEVTLFRADLRDLDALPLSGARLVTVSALLDLTSAEWVSGLADRTVSFGLGIYAALSYDGHMAWTPADTDDHVVVAAFNQHQLGDKGFGPALGPGGGAHLAEMMRTRGYRVWTAESQWRLGTAARELQRELLAGIARAALEAGFRAADKWHQRRIEALSTTSCVVGHVDVLALPSG